MRFIPIASDGTEGATSTNIRSCRTWAAGREVARFVQFATAPSPRDELSTVSSDEPGFLQP